MNTITAVLFDADGVIQLAPDRSHARLIEALGRPMEEREACLSELFAAEAPALVSETPFEVGLQAALDRMGAQCDVETVIRHFCTINCDARVMAVIQQIRQAGVYCALASNQERNRARHMSKQLGHAQAFDREFYSCDLGHAKPSPRYFEEVIRLSGLNPSQTLFIDDRPDNVETARQCGLVAEQFVLWQVEDGARAMADLLERHGLYEAKPQDQPARK